MASDMHTHRRIRREREIEDFELRKRSVNFICASVCWHGGIGRRKGLKIPCCIPAPASKILDFTGFLQDVKL